MKIMIVYRKNGRVIIEADDDADEETILKEHEITTYLKLTIQKHGINRNP